MRSRLLLLALVISAALVGGLIALLLRPSADSAAPQVHDDRVTLIPAARRKDLPDLSGAALSPPPARLRLRPPAGKPAFIDVWASWCYPCRQEAAMLARLSRRYRAEVRFVGIDLEDTRDDARAFVRRYRLRYPSIFDPKATLAGKLGFFGLPTAYLIDRQGRIAGKIVGRQNEATLQGALADLSRAPAAGR